MSNKSNDEGRAYEYITLITLGKEISKLRVAEIEKNSSFFAAQNAYNSISSSQQNNLKKAAEAMIPTIFELEPLIVEDGDDMLTLLIQQDEKGEEGDVRDILIIRRSLQWEIGLSMKHNHFAAKHSRLSPKIDFGEKWYGYPCSDSYKSRIKSIFNLVHNYKLKGYKWSEMPHKENDVYIPLLQAFKEEVLSSYSLHHDIPSRLVEYLLGKFDFYKVVGIDRQHLTEVQAYNLHGDLNHPSSEKKSKIIVPISELPTRIVELDFKPGSDNTLELYLDRGWQFSFRIHNASTYVEESLKFDIQIIGMPTTIITINCQWR